MSEKLEQIQNNGHAYVDLGLPSGTLWAKMNVGANSETDYGLYFAWGETTGYPDGKSGKTFSSNDYTHGEILNPSKYNRADGKTVLDLEDDAARVNMGGQWHMPTAEQMRELAYGTTNGYVTSDGTFTQYTWVPVDEYAEPSRTTASTGSKFGGVAGLLFFKTGVALSDALSNGEYLFVPSAGYCDEGLVGGVGRGCVWSSSVHSGGENYAWYLYFNDGQVALTDYYRCNGHSVRGVIDGRKQNNNKTDITNEDKDLLFQDISARLPYGLKGKCEIDASYDTSFDTIFQLHKFDAILEGIKEGLLFVTPLIEDKDEQEFANEEVADGIDVLDFKPYLRPMSSMTEEEREDFWKNVLDIDWRELDFDEEPDEVPFPFTENYCGFYLDNFYLAYSFAVIDWLNKKMFDYRGLIPRGCAIAVTEENNPYKD